MRCHVYIVSYSRQDDAEKNTLEQLDKAVNEVKSLQAQLAQEREHAAHFKVRCHCCISFELNQAVT